MTTEPLDYPFNEPAGLALSEEYAAAREREGMIRVQLPHGEPAWLATRYADARFVLGDGRFSRAMAGERDAPRYAPENERGGILGLDPPDHTRLRVLIAKAFTMRRIELLRPRIREIAGELVANLLAAGAPADLVEDFALPLPVSVICELLGVPLSDREKFRSWSSAISSAHSVSPEELRACYGEVNAYMHGLIEEHRANPADDLMTALIEARDVHDRLTEDELVGLCVAVLVGGTETTASQIPNFVQVLLEHPERWRQLREEPELIPAAVEELIRFVPTGVGANMPRYAKEDVEVGGVLVRAGEAVLVAITAANRDALQFDSPEELIFTRESSRHLGLGHGVHHCLGAPLARVELQEALRVLSSELPGLGFAGEITWKTKSSARGARTMPVRW